MSIINLWNVVDFQEKNVLCYQQKIEEVEKLNLFENLNLFCLTHLITLVLLMWEWMDVFL